MGIFAEFLRRQEYSVDVSDTLASYEDADRLNAYDLIVQCWTMGEISRDQRNNLVAAVRSGVGLAGWHGGIVDAFRNNATYQFMTGAQFVAHPGDISRFEVNVARADDPIMKDIQNFSVDSEQYFMHIDPTNEVLATTTFSDEYFPEIAGCVMPVVYKRVWGQGKIFVSALGHIASEFDKPEVRTIMQRGLLWASR